MLTSIADILLLIVRWIHISTAVIWVGGGVFYLIAVRPIKYTANRNLNETIPSINKNLTHISDISILSLTSTGTIIMLNALLQQNLTALYISILVIKLFLSVLIFTITINKKRVSKYKVLSDKTSNRIFKPFTNYTFITLTGMVIIILSDMLRSLNIS